MRHAGFEPLLLFVKCDSALPYLDRGCASRRVAFCCSVHQAAGRRCLHVQWLWRAGPPSYPSQVRRQPHKACITPQHHRCAGTSRFGPQSSMHSTTQWPISMNAASSWRYLPRGLVLHDHELLCSPCYVQLQQFNNLAPERLDFNIYEQWHGCSDQPSGAVPAWLELAMKERW